MEANIDNNYKNTGRKFLYSILIILAVTLIYALTTGLFFSCIYLAADYTLEVDVFFEGYFYLLSILGILILSLYMKHSCTKKRIFTAYSASLLAVTAGTAILFLPMSKPLFTGLLLLLFVVFGCTQGCYVFLLTMFLSKKDRCMSLGIAASLSVIINALLSLIADGSFVKSAYVLIVYAMAAVFACLLLYYALFRLPQKRGFAETPECKEHKETALSTDNAVHQSFDKKSFLLACGFIALSFMIQSIGFYFPYNDSLILGISAEVLRVTNILGLLVAGYLSSRNKRIGAIISLITLATPMLYIALQAQAGMTLLLYFLSYIFTGFLSIYRFGITSDMSDSVDKNGNAMTYLCAFGLAFGRFGEGVGGIIGIRLNGNTLFLLTVTCFILVIAVAFFIFHYVKTFIPVPKIVKTHEDQINSFKTKFALSSREIEVVELLLDNKSNAEIADILYVSENTVKFHVSNILKKTGCKTRKEVSALFQSEASASL